MHLHDFLGRVHELLRPKNYLEIGVQYGTSLQRAVYSELAIGVDPRPLVTATYNQKIYPISSDLFFEHFADQVPPIHFGFIDGLHHSEQALRDFAHMEPYIPVDGILIFDDVLPRNQEEASREQCPGDWTGDVWKVAEILHDDRPDLDLTLVATEPTGVLVVQWTDYRATVSPEAYQEAIDSWRDVTMVPGEIINRTYAMSPEWMLQKLAVGRLVGQPFEYRDQA